MKPELFGTIFRPNARWTCLVCKRANVTTLVVPIKTTEIVACKGCHRTAKFSVDLAAVPRVWGGTKEEATPT
jgi:hypothetical protein